MQVTCSASILQDRQTFLINFNLLNEWYLAIWVVSDAKCQMITIESMVLLSPSPSLSLSLSLTAGLWVIASHARMLGLRPQCLAEVSDFSGCWKVPTTGISAFFFCHFKAPMDSPLLFHSRVSLGMLCFILGQAACRYRLFPLPPYCQLH